MIKISTKHLLSLLLMIHLCSFAYGGPERETMEEYIDILVQLIDSFQFEETSRLPESYYKEFRKFYGLDYPETEHYLGYLSLENYDIATYYFTPEAPVGTVIVLHGYYDHVGTQRNLIRDLLKQNYAVLSFDLPGHGLSSGKKADINDFNEYSNILVEIAKLAREHSPGPYHLIGHSTGAATILNCLWKNKLEGVSKIVLTAPLVRSQLWHLSMAGNSIGGLFFKEVPRVFRKTSSDSQYLNFIENQDVLQYKSCPLNWVKALFSWNKEIAGVNPIQRPILLIQGNKDLVVDWKHNLKFIQEKTKGSQIIMIDGARHQLYNESEEFREEVFINIREYLKQ